MKCPVCTDTTLAMTNREGIEIDYCPKCRGVWLDRGELDKIVERSTSAAPAPQAAAPNSGYSDPRHAQGGYRPHGDDDDYRKQQYDKHYHGKRRKGFLGDLFDFD